MLSNDQINDLEAKIADAQSDEEVVEIFAASGINVSKEQLQSLEDDAEKELTEDNLEMVVGGSKLWQVIRNLYNRYRTSSYKGGGGGFSKGGGGGSFGGGGGGGARGF